MSTPASIATGTQLAVIGTEHTLQTINTPGTFVLEVNTLNMLNGDTVELRAYKKVLTGDAQSYLAYEASYTHKQGDGAAPGSSAGGAIVKLSVPVPSLYQTVFTLKQPSGTGRNFPWSIMNL